MESTNKTWKYYLVLLIVSIFITISPIIVLCYYVILDSLNIMPIPNGAGALSFMMLFTIPGGAAFFTIGSIIVIITLEKKKHN